jgi:hypothetical protein
VLRPEVAAIIGAERFLKEIETTPNLQHPNILPLFDSGRVEGTVFYVKALRRGESLRARLRREVQLPIADEVRTYSRFRTRASNDGRSRRRAGRSRSGPGAAASWCTARATA